MMLMMTLVMMMMMMMMNKWFAAILINLHYNCRYDNGNI